MNPPTDPSPNGADAARKGRAMRRAFSGIYTSRSVRTLHAGAVASRSYVIRETGRMHRADPTVHRTQEES